MHASPVVPLLHRWLRRACPAIHAVRVTAVVTAVEAFVLGAKLALTPLGRNLRRAAFAKHSIPRTGTFKSTRSAPGAPVHGLRRPPSAGQPAPSIALRRAAAAARAAARARRELRECGVTSWG